MNEKGKIIKMTPQVEGEVMDSRPATAAELLTAYRENMLEIVGLVPKTIHIVRFDVVDGQSPVDYSTISHPVLIIDQFPGQDVGADDEREAAASIQEMIISRTFLDGQMLTADNILEILSEGEEFPAINKTFTLTRGYDEIGIRSDLTLVAPEENGASSESDSEPDSASDESTSMDM